MVCIYCQEDKPQESFSKEHVLPRSFGKFKNDFTLVGMVCGQCNQFFGDHLELFLGRDTFEGLSRVDVGIQKPEDFKSAGKRARTIIRVEEGFFRGAYAYRDYSPEQGKVTLLPVPQVGLLKNDQQYEFYTFDNLPRKNELDPVRFLLNEKRSYLILGPDRNLALKELERKGYGVVKPTSDETALEGG